MRSNDEIGNCSPSPSCAAKHYSKAARNTLDRDALRSHLELLKRPWPTIRERLSQQLIPAAEVADMLAAAGCPTRPEQIGISRERLRIELPQSTAHSPPVHDSRSGVADQSLGPSTRPCLPIHRTIRMSVRRFRDARTSIRLRRGIYWQARILTSTIIGYALYYFVRKNLSVAMPAMADGRNQQSSTRPVSHGHGVFTAFRSSPMASSAIGSTLAGSCRSALASARSSTFCSA